MTENIEYEHSFEREKLRKLTYYKTVFWYEPHIFA